MTELGTPDEEILAVSLEHDRVGIGRFQTSQRPEDLEQSLGVRGLRVYHTPELSLRLFAAALCQEHAAQQCSLECRA